MTRLSSCSSVFRGEFGQLGKIVEEEANRQVIIRQVREKSWGPSETADNSRVDFAGELPFLSSVMAGPPGYSVALGGHLQVVFGGV